jgi:hypothetical protein
VKVSGSTGQQTCSGITHGLTTSAVATKLSSSKSISVPLLKFIVSVDRVADRSASLLPLPLFFQQTNVHKTHRCGRH